MDRRLAAAGVTAAEVQAAWLKPLVQGLRARFPNLTLLYVSSRIYAGCASSALNPEPYAYQGAFSVKWLLEAHLAGSPDLRYDTGRAPWLAWGPCLWADGTTERDDGLTWVCSDFQASDGTHPADAGRQKVARLLLDFLKADSTSRSWFVRPPAEAPLCLQPLPHGRSCPCRWCSAERWSG